MNPSQLQVCVYLGICQAQPSHAAAAVGFGVNGAELLFNGAEISHKSIKIHVLPLIQRLCTETQTFQDVRLIDQ